MGVLTISLRTRNFGKPRLRLTGLKPSVLWVERITRRDLRTDNWSVAPLTVAPIRITSPLEELIVSTLEKVTGIVSEQLGVEEDKVLAESSFVEDLKADSLDVVELVMEFEDEFSITIPDDDYEKILTVGDAVNYIDEATKKADV